MEPHDTTDPINLVRSLIAKVSKSGISDEGKETLGMLQVLEAYVLRHTSESEEVSFSAIEERGKKVFMENNLDLNETEVDYYEEMVNDLATRLEACTHEKQILQEQFDSCKIRVNSYEKKLEESNKDKATLSQSLEVAERRNLELLELSKNYEQLTTELQQLGIVCGEASSKATIFSSVNDFMDNHRKSGGYGPSFYVGLVRELAKVVSSEKVASRSNREDLDSLDAKNEQVKAQAKQLHLLQDLNHELKVKLEVLQRDNGLLQQEVQILKRMTESKQIGGQDSLLSWMSDELKVLDLTASLKEVTKQNHKLASEVENLEAALNLKTRIAHDLQKENDILKDNLRKLQSEYDSVRVFLVKHESSSKLKQLDRDEEVELMRQRLMMKEEELAEVLNSFKFKELELTEAHNNVESLKVVMAKLMEKEDMNDTLIMELRKESSSSKEEDFSMQKKIISNFTNALKLQLSQISNLENLIHERLRREFVRVARCTDKVIKARKIHEQQSFMKAEAVVHAASRDPRLKGIQFESKSAELEESSSLKSMVAASEKRLELISADYAKNYAQNSKVFAFLENECCRLKGLCDHLRSVNSKINSELKKAMFHENKSKSLEQKLRIVRQNEQIWADKCKKLENTLKVKNEELLTLLRGQEEAESSRVLSLERDLDNWRGRCESLQKELSLISTKNEEFIVRIQENALTFANEKKLLELKVESSRNEILLLSRNLSEQEMEFNSLKSKFEEQGAKLLEADLRASLLNQEIVVHDESSQRKIIELSAELEERVKKVEQLASELQKAKSKLYETESKLLSVDEELSKIHLRLTEKEEVIDQLERTVSNQTKQIVDLNGNELKLRKDAENRVAEVRELIGNLDAINESYQLELKRKLEMESTLRISSEKSLILEQQISSHLSSMEEMRQIIRDQEAKIQELLEKSYQLEERAEFLQAANDSLSASNTECVKELENVFEKNRILETNVLDLKATVSSLEDKIFEADISKTHFKEQLEFAENKIKGHVTTESVLARKLRNLSDHLSRLTSFEVGDVLLKTFDGKHFEGIQEELGSFLLSSDLASLEENVKLSLIQFSLMSEKAFLEMKQKQHLMQSEEAVKIAYENLKLECAKLQTAKESQVVETKQLQAALLEQKEQIDRVKSIVTDLVTGLKKILCAKHEDLLLVLKSLPEVTISPEPYDWNLTNLEISHLVASSSAKVEVFADSILDACRLLVSRCTHLQVEISQLQKLNYDQSQVFQNEKEALQRSNETLRSEISTTQSNLLDLKRKSDDLSKENVDLRCQIEEHSVNYAELEKEFKSVANTNVELAQSLTEAENICVELRNNFKIAESQLEESRSSLSQAQYQLNMLQKRCAESETRFETLSFSFKRLKAEKEALENVKLNLEMDLDRVSSQSLLLTANGNNDEYNFFIFEIEKISSVLDSMLTVAHLEEFSKSFSSKSEEIMFKLEKLRGWIKNSNKDRSTLEKEKLHFEELCSTINDELVLKKQELDSCTKSNLLITADMERVRAELEVQTNSLRTKIVECDQFKSHVESVNSALEEASNQRLSLESENRKLESELRLTRNELNLREDAVKRLKQDLDSSKVLEEELREEISQRVQQLETAMCSCESMTSIIQQLEQQIQDLKFSRTSMAQQLQHQLSDESNYLKMQQQLEAMRLELEAYKNENTMIKTDKLTVEEANLTLRKELEITRSKAVSLEQHVALVQQEKSVFIDEINETRRKIQVAKESFEMEKTQRIRSEAAAAALKQAQTEVRLKLPDYHPFSSASSHDESDRKQMKTVIQDLKVELEQKGTQLSRERLEKEELQLQFENLKTQLADRLVELKQASSFSNNFRVESKQARQRLFEAVAILRELIHFTFIDTRNSIEENISVFNHETRENSNRNESEERSLKLLDSLGIEEVYSAVATFQTRYSYVRDHVRSLQQRMDSLTLQCAEITTLRAKILDMEQERQRVELSYSQEIQNLHNQLNHFRSTDMQQSNLIQKINALEISLKQEREQKEAFLSELMEMIAKSNHANVSEDTHTEITMYNSEVSRLRLELSGLKTQNDDMKREIEAINHHRTVLKAVVEDLEVQLQGSNDKAKFHPSNDSRYSTEEDISWEIDRLKRKLATMNELCRIYHTGLVALSNPRFTDSGSGTEFIQRDTLIKTLYEEDVRLLDLRIDELQMKLRQYRKYGLEVKKQFEEMLKSIHRIGKQPAMDIAIRQIEHLRAQLEESQDYIASLQDEASQDRKFYRSRLNGFADKIAILEKFRHYSGLLFDKVKITIPTFKMSSDVQEILKEIAVLYEQILQWNIISSVANAVDQPAASSDLVFDNKTSTYTTLKGTEITTRELSVGRGTLRINRSSGKSNA